MRAGGRVHRRAQAGDADRSKVRGDRRIIERRKARLQQGVASVAPGDAMRAAVRSDLRGWLASGGAACGSVGGGYFSDRASGQGDWHCLSYRG